jgi:hypothetical protein
MTSAAATVRIIIVKTFSAAETRRGKCHRRGGALLSYIGREVHHRATRFPILPDLPTSGLVCSTPAPAHSFEHNMPYPSTLRSEPRMKAQGL